MNFLDLSFIHGSSLDCPTFFLWKVCWCNSLEIFCYDQNLKFFIITLNFIVLEVFLSYMAFPLGMYDLNSLSKFLSLMAYSCGFMV